MSLPWLHVIEPIPEEEGGGWMITIPQLGAACMHGDGESVQEAYENLRVIMEDRLTEYLKEGLDIPEPDEDESWTIRRL